MLCKHLTPLQDRPSCRAFPAGIPGEIFHGREEHFEPIGDEAVVFEKADDVSDEEVAHWRKGALEGAKARALFDMGEGDFAGPEDEEQLLSG